MRRALPLLLLLSLGAAAPQDPAIVLRPGMVITRSVRIVPGTYRFPAPASLDSPLVTIRGTRIVVDFQGAVLEGVAPGADPDQGRGLAILVDGGASVRVQGAVVRGYKVGLMARGTRAFALVDSDLSYNWKPRLYSLVEHESLSDWLSYHHNEAREWLRFGAAIYLEDVRGGEIRGTRAVQGMNGLLMVRSDSLVVRDNTFAWNSGLGIGMYRSSDNRILRNRMDYNVRGHSERFYHRGQDSAALLMYAESHRNVVAYNSATHSGDGLFVWAGQATMDSGTGGVNDNLFYGNDFSYAPTNAMEATFSRNTFVANRAAGSTYGLWGGYSWSSRIVGNCFAGNRYGVAIEHGQDNLIAWNRFDGDTTAIQLWARESQPADWGYARHRDTRSRDTRIEGNIFAGNRVAVRGTRTQRLTASGNVLAGVDSAAVFADTSEVQWGAHTEGAAPPVTRGPGEACGPLPAEYAALAPTVPDGAAVIPESDDARRPRAAIIVDEWGPYDWRAPRLWPVGSARTTPLRLAVLGPGGRWRVVGRRGIAALSAMAGAIGDTITVTPAAGEATDWELTLEYRGGAAVSPRGERRPAGAPVRFSYSRFEPRTDWTVRFFRYDSTSHPLDRPDAFAATLAGAPLLERRESRLDYLWYRPPYPELPQERFALTAEGVIALPRGAYSIRTISDDAVRVWVDGALVIDQWAPHESAVAVAPVAAGRHAVRVVYYQVGGWVELRLDVVRGRQPAGGSPGPH